MSGGSEHGDYVGMGRGLLSGLVNNVVGKAVVTGNIRATYLLPRAHSGQAGRSKEGLSLVGIPGSGETGKD